MATSTNNRGPGGQPSRMPRMRKKVPPSFPQGPSHYSMIEAVARQPMSRPPFPIVSFNHLSREVLDVRAARDFYVGVLGFIEIPRPAFDVEGVWVYGFGLSLHIIKSRYPEKRMLLKGRRLEHFENAMPEVDHMAFITSNINEVEKQLRMHNVFYKRFESPKTGISQIFVLDPDHNVIEISNCAPPVGEVACPKLPGVGGSFMGPGPLAAAPHSRL